MRDGQLRRLLLRLHETLVDAAGLDRWAANACSWDWSDLTAALHRLRAEGLRCARWRSGLRQRQGLRLRLKLRLRNLHRCHGDACGRLGIAWSRIGWR